MCCIICVVVCCFSCAIDVVLQKVKVLLLSFPEAIQVPLSFPKAIQVRFEVQVKVKVVPLSKTTFHMAHSVESFASFVFELCLCVLIWLQEPICGESWEQFVRDWIVTTDYKERTREALCI